MKNTTTQGEETFGERALRIFKSKGRPLPLPEEKILKLKPGRPAKVSVPEQYKGLVFIGMCHYAQGADGRITTPYGFYKMAADNGFQREQYVDVNACLNVSFVYYSHKLGGVSTIPLPYVNPDGRVYYYEWDADTWQPTKNNKTKANKSFTGLSQNPVTGTVYGFEFGGSYGDNFGVVDMDKQSTTTIAHIDSTLLAFDINSHGSAYAITTNSKNQKSYLSKVNLSTGKFTCVGELDFAPVDFLQSMTFDEKTDKLYLTASEISDDEETLTSSIREIDTLTAKSTLLAYLPNAEEYTALRVIDHAPAGEPADLTDLKAAFVKDTNNGTISFTLPSKSRAGQPLTEQINYTITLNDDEGRAIHGSGNPGEKVSINKTFDVMGKLKVVVVLSNDAGKGHRNVVTTYVGNDTPKPHDVTFSYDEDTKMAKVTWANMGVGANGGYYDPSTVKFDVVRMPDNAIVASRIAETSFSESLADVYYKGYYYKVIPYQEDQAGVADSSAVVYLGKGREIPYSEDFSNTSVGKDWTFIDANHDNVTWSVQSYVGGKLYYNYSPTEDADDWALTPPLSLKANTIYYLTFNASSTSTRYTEYFSVSAGKGEDVSTYTQILPQQAVSCDLQTPKSYSASFNSNEAGNYRFGFHAESPKLHNALFVDDISVTEGPSLLTPDSVRNLVVTPGNDGDLTATIDFDVPNQDILHHELSKIDTIIVRRGNDVVTTLTDVIPGSHQQVTDANAINGMQTYTVVCVNSYGEGLSASASAYVGYDKPLPPTSVRVKDHFDGTAEINWDKSPAKGVNGGFADQDNLIYTICDLLNDSKELASGVGLYSYQLTNLDQTGSQDYKFFSVNSENDFGKSDKAIVGPFFTGAAYNTPYVEPFNSNELNGIWVTHQSDEGEQMAVFTGASADGDGNCAGYKTKNIGTWSEMQSGKISLSGTAHPRLSFATFVIPGAKDAIQVAVNKDGETTADTLLTVNFATAGNEAGWTGYSIDLSKYKTAHYVNLTFRATVNDYDNNTVLFDDINVYDGYTNNLTSTLKPPYRAKVGSKTKVRVIVRNMGTEDANAYNVDLYVNGKKEQTLSNQKALTMLNRNEFEFTYTPKASDANGLSMYAVVNYNKDENHADDTTSISTIRMFANDLNAATNLAASEKEGKVTLTWDSPSDEWRITDDFEGYDSYLVDHFGDWTTYDGDGSNDSGLTGLYVPNTGGAMSFMTIDFVPLGADLSKHPRYAGCDGSSQMVTTMPATNNENWLISPELTGNEQDIEFYARKLDGIFDWDYYVLYSTTSNKSDDFEVLSGPVTAVKDTWTKVTATLPSGTKYFAICAVSDGGKQAGMFQIDNVTYERKPLTLTGYNIYRDNEIIATVDAGTCTYSDNTPFTSGRRAYNVTAVYGESESGYSNTADVVSTGIKNLESGNCNITGGRGFITINGAGNAHVDVYTLNGSRIYSGLANEISNIHTASGLYLVKVNGKSYRVVVR